jgi:hypothetical protein
VASDTFVVAASADDGFEDGGGTTDNNGNFIELGNSGWRMWGFWRFACAIPKDSTITTAEITIEWGTYGGTVDAIAYCEDIASAPAVVEAANNITDRTLTTASTTFTLTAGAGGGDDKDVAAPLQEVVNRGDWVSGNYAGIIITDNGDADSWAGIAYDHPTLPPAELYVVWTPPGVSIPVAMHHYGHHFGKIIRG